MVRQPFLPYLDAVNSLPTIIRQQYSISSFQLTLRRRFRESLALINECGRPQALLDNFYFMGVNEGFPLVTKDEYGIITLTYCMIVGGIFIGG